MSKVDTLLDAAVNDGKIIITVDEPSRTLKYDGTILLGVEDDHLAERIYFQAPRYIIMDDTVDLLSENQEYDVEIYVKYKNANHNISFTQCTDIIDNGDDTVTFSWLVTENVTDMKGTVQFSVWIRKLEDGINEVGDSVKVVANQWHTTIFKGTILDGIEINNYTPEVITNETSSTHLLMQKVDDLQATFDEYTGPSMTEVNERCEEMEEYVRSELSKYLDSTRVGYVGTWEEQDPYIRDMIPVLTDQAEYPTIRPSGMYLDDLVKTNTYQISSDMSKEFTGSGSMDFSSIMNNYNDVMIIIVAKTNTTSQTPTIVVNALNPNDNTEAGEQLRFAIPIDKISTESTTNTYYKISINKTKELEDDMYGYAMTLISSKNDYEFRWGTLTSDFNQFLLTVDVLVLDGGFNTIVKIYGR